jgi:putative transposase
LYVAAYRDRFGLEPICRVLQVNASTVRSRLARPPSATAIADEDLKAEIQVIFDANYRVYGCRKIKAVLAREHGVVVDKDRVARLMRELGIRGVIRGRKVFTTKSDPAAERAPDLVNRTFTAERPNALWVSDFTYVPSWAGMVYVAFVLDVYSRFIVGWRASTTMRTDLVMDALNQGVHARCTMLTGLITHSEPGQYTSIRYTERLAEIGAQPSIGSIGDSYDNAMAESLNGLYKAELIWQQGPWRNVEHVELATLLWVEWFNHRRLHGELGHLTPSEVEDLYYRHPRLETPAAITTRT